MKNFASLLALPAMLPLVLVGNAHACLRSVICASGQTNYFEMAQRQQKQAELAQYYPQPQPQYHGPSFFQGSSGPVVVPPTVINPPGPRECRKRRVSFLLVFERETADC
jgi:hypothetical protein